MKQHLKAAGISIGLDYPLYPVVSANADGTLAGEAKITRTVQLASDAMSDTSAVGVELFDANGNLIATLCGSEAATRIVD